MLGERCTLKLSLCLRQSAQTQDGNVQSDPRETFLFFTAGLLRPWPYFVNMRSVPCKYPKRHKAGSLCQKEMVGGLSQPFLFLEDLTGPEFQRAQVGTKRMTFIGEQKEYV